MSSAAVHTDTEISMDHGTRLRPERMYSLIVQRAQTTAGAPASAKISGKELQKRTASSKNSVFKSAPGPLCTINLFSSGLESDDDNDERRRFARIRIHVNPPRYKENSPKRALVMLRFRTSQLSMSLIERTIDAKSIDGQFLDIQLPDVPLQSRRGWSTVLDRAVVIQSISTAFNGPLSPLEMDSVYSALSSVHVGLLCSGEGSKKASGCGIEQLEVSSTSALAHNVRQWFERSGDDSSPFPQDENGISATAMKLCVCWKCVRLAFAKRGQDSEASDATDQFSVGTLVSLSSAYANPSNIDAADGPMRPGDIGVVTKVDTAPVPQPVFVRTFNGKGAWYSLRALVSLPDGDTPTIAVSAGAKALARPLEILARNNEVDLSVCKMVHPLTPSQLARKLHSVNRDAVQLPSLVLPTAVAEAVPPSPGSTMEVESPPTTAADLLQIANRLDTVNHLARTFTDPLIAKFSVTGMKYLHNLIGSLPQISSESFPGLNGQLLARLRKATCDSVVIAEQWVYGPQQFDDERFVEAASLVLILAVKTYEMVRGACIRTASLRGLRLPLRPPYMQIGSSAVSSKSEAPSAKWSCGTCTFENEAGATACEVCGAEKVAQMGEDTKPENGGAAKADPTTASKDVQHSAIVLDEAALSQTVADVLNKTEMTSLARAAVVEYVGSDTSVGDLRKIPLEEIEMIIRDKLSATDCEVLQQVVGPALPPLLQQQVADKGVDGLAALEKLWLELELQCAPVVPSWMRDPSNVALGTRTPLPHIQNLQYGDFVGNLEAFVLRCDPAHIQHLANLWVLVLSPTSGGLSVQVVSTHAVGDRVMLVDDQTALVMLERPIPVLETHAVAFTCVSPTDDSQAVLESPRIFCSRPNGKRIKKFPEPVGCSASCSNSHSGHGNCLVCGSGWGSHSGHTCRAGTRGSWATSSSMSELPEVKPDSHIQISAGASESPQATVLSAGLRVGIASDEDKCVLQVRLFGAATSSTTGASGHGSVVAKGLLISATEAFATQRMIMNICARWAKHLLHTDRQDRETKLNSEAEKRRRHPPRKEHVPIIANIETIVRSQWAKHKHGVNVAKLGELYARQFGKPAYKKLGKLTAHCKGVRIEYPKASIKMLYPAETGKLPHPKMQSELRLSDSHVLWLLRTGMFRLCIMQTSDPDDASERGGLAVGAHVLVRQNEAVGFTEHGVVVASRVPGAQAGNTNKMVVYSGESSESVGSFLALQCAEADMSPMGPTQQDWQSVAIAAIKALRDSRASEGGASKSDAELSSRLLQREALLRQVAPFIVHHRQDISSADLKWFVDEMDASANPSEPMMKNLKLHIAAQQKAIKAM